MYLIFPLMINEEIWTYRFSHYDDGYKGSHHIILRLPLAWMVLLTNIEQPQYSFPFPLCSNFSIRSASSGSYTWSWSVAGWTGLLIDCPGAPLHQWNQLPDIEVQMWQDKVSAKLKIFRSFEMVLLALVFHQCHLPPLPVWDSPRAADSMATLGKPRNSSGSVSIIDDSTGFSRWTYLRNPECCRLAVSSFAE